jgi:hypothetical protein
MPCTHSSSSAGILGLNSTPCVRVSINPYVAQCRWDRNPRGTRAWEENSRLCLLSDAHQRRIPMAPRGTNSVNTVNGLRGRRLLNLEVKGGSGCSRGGPPPEERFMLQRSASRTDQRPGTAPALRVADVVSASASRAARCTQSGQLLCAFSDQRLKHLGWRGACRAERLAIQRAPRFTILCPEASSEVLAVRSSAGGHGEIIL